VSPYPRPFGVRTETSQPWLTMREIAVRTAGAAMSRLAIRRTSAATGAAPPRERRWAPYRSNSTERACTRPPPCSHRPGLASYWVGRRVAPGGEGGQRPDPTGHNGQSVRGCSRKGFSMAAMKPRTGDGPLEVTKEGRGIVMRVPLEGG